MNIILKILLIGFLLFDSHDSLAQLGRKTEKLAGNWEYKEGSGYETWDLDGEELDGHAYRINKMGDTTKVEDLRIKRVNKNLIHVLSTYNIAGDSTIVTTYRFVGGKRKLSFINIDSNTPYSIAYRFGFLNRNKLFIRIKYGMNEKGTKLTLKRVID